MDGCFNVVSFNCASWKAGLSAALERGTEIGALAHVVCLQELRVGERGRPAAFAAARGAGWGLTLATCGKGPGGRPSAGVGVCCKRHIRSGADVEPTVHNALVVPARAVATPLRIKGLS